MGTHMVTWTVPDRPEHRHYHPDRKCCDMTEDQAIAFAMAMNNDGARNVRIIDAAKPWRWSADGSYRVQP